MYFFRVTSNYKSGKGHLNRSLRIRKQLKGKATWFIDKGTNKSFFKESDDMVIEESKNTSLLQLETKLKKIKIKVKAIFIDMLLYDESKIKKIASIYPTILIVDKYLKLDNTLRICFHPIAQKDDNFISGFKYFPILKKNNIKKKNTSRKSILISFGNVDSKKLTEKVIKAFNQIFKDNLLDEKKLFINIVLGNFKKNTDRLKLDIINKKYYKVHQGLNDLEKLYEETEYAIGAPGFSQLERVEYCIPTILLSQNPIHKNLLQAWQRSKCAIIANNSINDLKEQIISLISSEKRKLEIKKNIIKSFDYKATARIKKKMQNFCNNYTKTHN